MNSTRTMTSVLRALRIAKLSGVMLGEKSREHFPRDEALYFGVVDEELA